MANEIADILAVFSTIESKSGGVNLADIGIFLK